MTLVVKLGDHDCGSEGPSWASAIHEHQTSKVRRKYPMHFCISKKPPSKSLQLAIKPENEIPTQ
jgi:hypothetical protein